MKVAELEGDALDEAVMRGLLDHMIGAPLNGDTREKIYALVSDFSQGKPAFHPSRDWSQSGPIIDREKIILKPYEDGFWGAAFEFDPEAHGGGFYLSASWEGQTALVAAMRAYVARKFGDELPGVDVTQRASEPREAQ